MCHRVSNLINTNFALNSIYAHGCVVANLQAFCGGNTGHQGNLCACSPPHPFPCRTLLHLHTMVCMFGAVCDLCAPPPQTPICLCHRGAPPPCLGTALHKNRPLVLRSNSRTTFLYHGIGFFMVLVDAGQLFRCAGQHFICVATGPSIRGCPISQSQAHIPLKPLPPALDPFLEATSP